MVNRTRPGTVFGEFGVTSKRPTVNRTVSALSYSSSCKAVTMRTAAIKASLRMRRGVVPACASSPVTSTRNQRNPWMPETMPIVCCVASRSGPCSIWA
jgi:hypothetical protein